MSNGERRVHDPEEFGSLVFLCKPFTSSFFLISFISTVYEFMFNAMSFSILFVAIRRIYTEKKTSTPWKWSVMSRHQHSRRLDWQCVESIVIFHLLHIHPIQQNGLQVHQQFALRHVLGSSARRYDNHILRLCMHTQCPGGHE